VAQWLLDSEEYKKWGEGSEDKLLCFGLPGAGKTMIAAIVINGILTRYANERYNVVLFIYCNYNRVGAQDSRQFFSNLLRQIVYSSPSVPDAVEASYKINRS